MSMFDTLYIGTSGMLANAFGLKIVSNNLANVNTAGFKSSQPRFDALFEQGNNVLSGQGDVQFSLGQGVATLGSQVSFLPGSDEATGNALDQSINGDGMFVVRRDGELLYTRLGDFSFNRDNVLVNGHGDHVQGLDDGGRLADITLDGLDNSAAQATSTVAINGNLTTTVATPPVNATLNGVKVIDAAGASHNINLSFKDNGGGSFTVTVTDGATGGAVLGSGTVRFNSSGDGAVISGSSSVPFSYTASGVVAFPVTLDFSKLKATLQSTSLTTGAVDGHPAGVRTSQTIDADGTINVVYSNGEKETGQRIALAQFATEDDLVQGSGGMFRKTMDAVAQYGRPGGGSYGSLLAGHREGSNVDLAGEFNNLIVMQRGYQAASHVISTTNDMIQELFDMKGNR